MGWKGNWCNNSWEEEDYEGTVGEREVVGVKNGERMEGKMCTKVSLMNLFHICDKND